MQLTGRRSVDVSNKRVYYKIIIILGALAGIMPLSIDLYLPGFSQIAYSLHTTPESMGVTLSAFFTGICLGQLFYGPLLDRYGRIKPLLFGLCLFVLASFATIFVTNLTQLTVLRFIQAFGGCATFVSNRAIARDLFPGKELVKVFSMLMLILGIAPIIAPTLGSIILATFPWQAIFVFLTLVGIVLLIAAFLFLSNTQPPDKTVSLKPIPVLKNYWTVFKNPVFTFHTLSFSFSSAALFSYITAAPFVFMELHNMNTTEFGLAFGFNASALIIGSQFNRVIIKYWDSRKIAINMAFITFGIATVLFILSRIIPNLPLYVIIACLSLLLFFTGMFNPNASAIALGPFSHNAGMASALSGFCQMGLNAIVSMLVAQLSDGTIFPMVFMILLCTIGCLVSLFGVNIYYKTWNWKSAYL